MCRVYEKIQRGLQNQKDKVLVKTKNPIGRNEKDNKFIEPYTHEFKVEIIFFLNKVILMKTNS